jgi:hypothetical protein
VDRPPEVRPPADNGKFVPIRPNPYIVGNPVRGRSMFFGREVEFDLVRKRFQDSPHGGLLVFCGERRSGKTSILFQILDRRLGPDFIPVLVDMQSMAVATEADFLGKIAAEILQALGPDAANVRLPDFASTSSTQAAFQRFVGDVMRAHPGRKLILLFDEYELFENKIEAGVLSEDTLHVLANLMENFSIFIIFTGSQHLEARRRDYWNILGKSLYKRISYLDRQDALDLIRKPIEGVVHYKDGAVGDIYRMTAGQPFYTQAVCQNLVDWLNENATHEATREAVNAVSDGLVENPLPQMIFLWDTLARDEKLVLSLLAETLADENAFANVRQLVRTITRRDYPLDLDASRIAPALEKLFKEDELLLKNDDAVPGYAFRMDLWRRWIRRMHSVWQVMRQEGFAIRRRSRRRAWVVATALVVLPALAVILTRARDQPPPATPPQERDAATPIGEVRVQAAPPALGNLDVASDPPGARVVVDGEPRGASPLTLALAPGEHVVEATMPGREPVWRRIVVHADSTLRVDLALAVPTVQLVVTTDPVGALVGVDAKSLGAAPATAAGLTPGTHVFRVELPGWTTRDTTVQVTAALRQIHVQLQREPPGELEVRGDLAARLYVDGDPVGTAHLYNWKVPLAAGRHVVRVVPSAGEPLEASIQIEAGARIVYEYTAAGIQKAAAGGETR